MLFTKSEPSLQAQTNCQQIRLRLVRINSAQEIASVTNVSAEFPRGRDDSYCILCYISYGTETFPESNILAWMDPEAQRPQIVSKTLS